MVFYSFMAVNFIKSNSFRVFDSILKMLKPIYNAQSSLF